MFPLLPVNVKVKKREVKLKKGRKEKKRKKHIYRLGEEKKVLDGGRKQ